MKRTGLHRVTTVSGFEVLLALKMGFDPGSIIFNGNGKKRWELEVAVLRGVVLNVDSVFDAERLVEVITHLEPQLADTKSPRVLLRINPATGDLEGNGTQVHPYNATGDSSSKFGIERKQLSEVLGILRGCGRVMVEGVHVHLGSTITDVEAFANVVDVVMESLVQVQGCGWPYAHILNMGGGLGVGGVGESKVGDGDNVGVNEESSPSPYQLVEAVVRRLRGREVKLIFEPGRSLVATAGVLVTEILGMKENGRKKFLVVDAAMTEIIRPALYQAYHHISYTTVPTNQQIDEFDVVGPVCECGDFMAKCRRLLVPELPSKAQSHRESHRQPLVVQEALGNSDLAEDLEQQKKNERCSSSQSLPSEYSTSSVPPALFSQDVPKPQLLQNAIPSSVMPPVATSSLLPPALVIWMAGAYCASMSSNYNLRPLVAEVLVTSQMSYRVIRRPQDFANVIHKYGVLD
ncbi:uncharacterized protein LOC143018211 isoform X2 [Oratosquilla oratoria]